MVHELKHLQLHGPNLWQTTYYHRQTRSVLQGLAATGNGFGQFSCCLQTRGGPLLHTQLLVPRVPSASRAAHVPYDSSQLPYALTLHAMVGPRLPRQPSPRTWARPPWTPLLRPLTPLLSGARFLLTTEAPPSSTSTCGFVSRSVLGSPEEEASWSRLADGEDPSPEMEQVRCRVRRSRTVVNCCFGERNEKAVTGTSVRNAEPKNYNRVICENSGGSGRGAKKGQLSKGVSVTSPVPDISTTAREHQCYTLNRCIKRHQYGQE